MRRSLKFASTAAAASIAVALSCSAVAVASGSGDQPPTEQDRDPISTMAVTSNPEMLYVAITPCRIVDTRKAGGRIAANATRNFYVSGTTKFSEQGGKNGGCGIPESARSIAATVTAAGPSKAGALRAWPTGESPPKANVLSYGKQQIGTGVTLSIKPGTSKALTVKPKVGSTNVFIDVFGYYVPQLQAYISSSGTIIDQSGRLVSVTKTGTGNYTLEWDRDISACSGQGTSDLTGHIISVYTSGVYSYVYSVDNSGAASDYWSNVLITC